VQPKGRNDDLLPLLFACTTQTSNSQQNRLSSPGASQSNIENLSKSNRTNHLRPKQINPENLQSSSTQIIKIKAEEMNQDSSKLHCPLSTRID
jgi:hypothetical protein